MNGDMRPAVSGSGAYAGFWRRFAAACIDLVLYAPVYVGMRCLFDLSLSHAPGTALADASVDFSGTAARASEIYRWWFEGLFALVALGSYSWFFSSRWQGSPGMRLLKFRITDTEGRRIGFLRAFAWCMAGTGGWIICCAGLLYLQKDLESVRDMLASCNEQNIEIADCIPEIEKIIGIPFPNFVQLMWAAAGLMIFMFFIWALSIAIPRDKTGFHNLLCGTRFVKDPDAG